MLSVMNIDNLKILAAIIATTLLVLPAAIFTTGPLRITLGLLFMVFFPGYTLLSALFPRSGDLNWSERVALSFGISIAVISCIGLILLVVPWGYSFIQVPYRSHFLLLSQRLLPTTGKKIYRKPSELALVLKSTFPGGPTWAN